MSTRCSTSSPPTPGQARSVTARCGPPISTVSCGCGPARWATTRCDVPAGVRLERAALLSDRSLTGGSGGEAYTRLVDEWLAALFDAASPPASGVALVAIGGY